VAAEHNGGAQLIVSEHHGSPDGFLPSPLPLASAFAARTRTCPILVSALIVPLYDPIKLAEDMAVLDLLSGGRVSYITAVGYRPEEYEQFGRSFRGRGKRMDECLTVLHQAWTGEPFEFEGRRVQVTPKPHRPGGPQLLMGGSSAQAVRRAAQWGMGLFPQGQDPSIREAYEEECRRQGRKPGLCIIPPANTVTAAFVAKDPDQAWEEIGPYLLHDARMYASWLDGKPGTSTHRSLARNVEELRAQSAPYRIFTPEEAIEYHRNTRFLSLQPLCGGLPPRLAWRSLELIASEVLPALKRR